MTSTATSRHVGGTYAEYESGRGHGLVIFASVVLAVLSFCNLVGGIAAISRSRVFVANARYVVGDLRVWGWVILILVILRLAAAGGVLTGNPLTRWFGVAVVGLDAIGQIFFLASYLFWSMPISPSTCSRSTCCAPATCARIWASRGRRSGAGDFR